MDGDMLCGGSGDDTGSSCLQLQQGQWTSFPWTLNRTYFWHVTWRKPNGEIILMGNDNTTEVVSTFGSTNGFQLKYRA